MLLSNVGKLFSEYDKYNFSKRMKILDIKKHIKELSEYLVADSYIYDAIEQCKIKEDLINFLTVEKKFMAVISQAQDSESLDIYWRKFTDSKLPEMRKAIVKKIQKETSRCRALFTDYEKQIAAYRLRFYAHALASQEAVAFSSGNIHIFSKRTTSSSLLETQSGYATFKPYQGYDSTVFLNTKCFYPYLVYALTNPHFLLTVYGNKDYLTEYAHQVGEYDMELIEEVIKAVNFEKLENDHPHISTILCYILHTSFLHRDYIPKEIIEGNFTVKIIERFIQEVRVQPSLTDEVGNLKQQVSYFYRTLTSIGIMPLGLSERVFIFLNEHLGTDFSRENLTQDHTPLEAAIIKKYPGDGDRAGVLLNMICDRLCDANEKKYVCKIFQENRKNMFETRKVFALKSIDEFIKTIREKFAQTLHDERIQALRIKFNDAYERQDWLQVQRLWPVFTKFQRLLVSAFIEQGTENKHFYKYNDRDYPWHKKHGQKKDAIKEKYPNPQNKNDLLDKAWNHYSNHALNYTRIYVADDTHTLCYSSKNHPDAKTATLDFNPILSELTELGQAIHYTLANNKESNKSLPNVLVPTLYFVVTDKPHLKGGEHRRIFVPVNLLPLEEFPILLSNDSEDRVFVKEQDKKEIAIADCKVGYQMMGINPPNNLNGTKYNELNHSERVLIELLRNQAYVQHLVVLLQESLQVILNKKLEIGKYKVYAVALLSYSTNSICNYCTPSLVAQQGSHKNGFLYHLANELNKEGGRFKTSGYNKEQCAQAPEKLRMLSVVTANHPWTEQAYHLSDHSEATQNDIPNEHQHMANPFGALKLPGRQIDLHQLGRDEKNNAYPSHHCFFEYVGTKFRKYCHPVKGQSDFVATGHIFMSNSKRFIVPKENIDTFNNEVDAIILKQIAKSLRK